MSKFNGKLPAIFGSAVLIAIIGLGVAWGVVKNQQGVNVKEIEKKVDKEVFQMHMQSQQERLSEIKTDIRSIDKKIDKILEK